MEEWLIADWWREGGGEGGGGGGEEGGSEGGGRPPLPTRTQLSVESLANMSSTDGLSTRTPAPPPVKPAAGEGGGHTYRRKLNRALRQIHAGLVRQRFEKKVEMGEKLHLGDAGEYLSAQIEEKKVQDERQREEEEEGESKREGGGEE
mmetsp:Transcript_21100/g.54845  ORF Transcript_21100/g.54845 Transcript_21100/m.54845 type:complete len:148 (+) Transcript_21100:258-701(+)